MKLGFAHLLIPVIIVLLIVGTVVLILVSQNKLTLPGTTKEPKVVVKTEYKNPFVKKTQYVNPFDQYKSPFLTFNQ